MFARVARERLRQLADPFPALLILGPRQVGKTTLARAVFPGAASQFFFWRTATGAELDLLIGRDGHGYDPRFAVLACLQ